MDGAHGTAPARSWPWRRAIPLVLCYHAVSSTWRSPLATPEELFRDHVLTLQRRGYTGLTLEDAERRRQAGTLPHRSVVFTFDDGFESTLRAKQLLDTVGWPATVFVVTAFVDSGEPLLWPGLHPSARQAPRDARSLGWAALQELVGAGWEIGSHTVTHPFLPEIGDRQLASELEKSRARIESALGACTTVAYPFGIADERIAAAARAAGYLAGCTLTPAHRVDEPYRRPRVGIAQDSGWRRRAKLSPVVGRLRRTRLAAALETFHVRGRLDALIREVGGGPDDR